MTLAKVLDDIKIRRKLLKQPGGEISVPVPRTNQKIKSQIKERVANGIYNLGVPIMETECQKAIVTKEGKFEFKSFNVSGRKIPLKEIRQKTLEREKQYCRYTNNENYDILPEDVVDERLKSLGEICGGSLTEKREHLKSIARERNWMIWHDHSSMANSGFMLFLMRQIYDPAFHLTKSEYKQKTGKVIDIQATIEKPHLYILGKAKATMENQLKFVSTRHECLQEMSQPLKSDNTPIKDTMRLMNGDKPAVEFECGNQKGGHYPCSGCDAHMSMADDYHHNKYRNHRTLEERKNIVLAGKMGKIKKVDPFKKLKKAELVNELKARNKDVSGDRKKLDIRLQETLRGATNVPPLLTSDLSVNDLNLQNYEVLSFEPLHDTMNHIRNIITELPQHITDPKVLITFKQIIAVLFDKEKVRGTDYRKALLKLTAAILGDVSQEVSDLLLSFIEMTKIYYAHDEERCPRQILRLYNLSWLHSKMTTRVLCPPISLTYRKLFGIYYHAVIDHAPLIHRIICLRSINAEQTERCFDQIVDITKKTWNKQVEDLASNAFLHVQAEELIKGKDEVQAQDREIKRIASCLPTLSNSIVSKDLMTKKAKEWQAHLLQIADFLVPGPGVWWNWQEDGGVEFHDAPTEQNTRPDGPSMHHFRSSSIVKELSFLKECWERCCDENIELPLYKRYSDEGKIVFNKHPPCDNAGEDGQDDEEDVITEQMEVVRSFDEEDRETDDYSDMDNGHYDEAEVITEQMEVEKNYDEEGRETDDDNDTDDEYCEEKDGSVEEDIDEREDNKNKETHGIITGSDKEETLSRKRKNDDPITSISKKLCTRTLKTKTAKAVELIVGKSQEVEEFDNMKYNLGKNPQSRYYIDHYETSLAKVQVLVLKECTAISENIKTWDKDFFERNSSLPSNTDYHKDNDIIELLKRKNAASQLLKSWNMTIQLY
ncbi:hypothetical protein AC249_AIPGENE7033 [Exaiptasia diaphana]|nr:hypothetical protein AC249_AIPGENE7033 [Exaiptasia diaphana]